MKGCNVTLFVNNRVRMAICDSEDEFEPSIEVAVVVVVTAESWLLTVRSFSYFLLFFDALLRFLFVLLRV